MGFLPYLRPTTDWLTVTVPTEVAPLVLGEVRDVLSSAPGISGCQLEGWRFPSGGCVRVGEKGAVTVISCSGAALVELRLTGLFADYLRSLASDSHRVTRVDSALDVPAPAPPLLHALYSKACRGEVRLTHKPSPVRRYMGPSEVEGVDTGTVYLGSRDAKARARVYDKRRERMDHGLPDPGDWIRYEFTGTGHLGVSLKDAWESAPLFWHYMGRSVLSAPPGVSAWIPGGEGFILPPRRVPGPSEAFQRRIEYSSELREIIAQARAIPDGAWRFFSFLRRAGIAPPTCPPLRHEEVLSATALQ